MHNPDNTFEASITQFHLPYGQRTSETILLSNDYKEFYDDMIKNKCELQAEVLTTGEVSITVYNGEEDIDFSITKNGPEVVTGLLKMLERQAWNNKDEHE